MIHSIYFFQTLTLVLRLNLQLRLKLLRIGTIKLGLLILYLIKGIETRKTTHTGKHTQDVDTSGVRQVCVCLSLSVYV